MHSSVHLVVGLGKTGHSIARYLLRRNLPFVVFDTRENPPGLAEFQQEFPGVDVYTHTFPKEILPNLAALIVSPGVSLDEPFLKEAAHQQIPIYGDIECLAQEIKDIPLIAITGTNGKSTVTTVVGEMAKASGLTVAVAGNIGLPVLDILDVGVRYDLWVLELSSFQLELTNSLKPKASTILNITPDHLDRHHTMSAYIEAKQRIYHDAPVVVYNREDEETLPKHDTNTKVQLISFGSDKPAKDAWGILRDNEGTFLAFGEEKLLSVTELKIKGQHNWMNALASAALATAVGISKKAIIQVLKGFAGLPHRSQWVRTFQGVDWINDSKGTNVGATVSAIAGIGSAIEGKIILIAGGVGKGADFSLLRDSMEHVSQVVLIGEDAPKIEKALADLVPITHAHTLAAAVKKAAVLAKPSDVVLLSPACASFDMFRDFNHRGDEFIAAVKAL